MSSTEAASPRYQDIETWPDAAVLEALWEAQMAAVAAVRPALPVLEAAVTAATARLRAGGRLAYAGAGTSGRIAVQDGAELTPTFNWPRDRLLLLMAGGDEALVRAVEGAEDQTEVAVAFGPLDVLVAVAASGTTPYTMACLRAAKAAGALSIGVASSPGTPLLAEADHAVLLDTGAEAVAGSTRLKAGTAQKAALNLFSTLLMTRLGRVYRGQMVDMLARNTKLRRRAVRMLVELTGTRPEQAAAALETTGHVKTAVLVLQGVPVGDAEAVLARSAGDLRVAVESAGTKGGSLALDGT